MPLNPQQSGGAAKACGTGSVRLFVPCLVDQVYPEIGIATVQVLRHLGFRVVYDPRQICCGQPAYNSGCTSAAARVALGLLDVFQDDLPIVCPSGSCAAMLRKFLPNLFPDAAERDAATRIAGHVVTLAEFLSRSGCMDAISGTYPGRIGFHNSCHSCRELGLGDETAMLLRRVAGDRFVVPDADPECCGFGGLFSARFSDIAETMATTRIATFATANLDVVVSNDPGCIMHMRQVAARANASIAFVHTAECLAAALGCCGEHQVE